MSDRSSALIPEPPPPAGSTGFLRSLGPGLVTGAADDDPSGIGTHSQIGAQFGYGLAWTFVLSFPLMVVIQQVAASRGVALGASGICASVELTTVNAPSRSLRHNCPDFTMERGMATIHDPIGRPGTVPPAGACRARVARNG